MSLTSKREIKNLFEKHQIGPSKRLGQNFLVDKGAVKKIIEAADLGPEDVILEVGPGLGVLTQELAIRVKKVIGIEKDPKMCEILKELLECWNVRNVEIIEGDILKLNTKYKIPNTKYKVVANLPFYLAAPVIRQFLEVENPAKEMVLVVQKEVGQRICAKPPGSKRINPLLRPSLPLGQMSILAVSVQVYSEPKIISYISKKSFWPQPKVDSAIIKITPIAKPNLAIDLFFKVVKAGFSQPRKQLINNLSKKLDLGKEKIQNWLLKNNIQPTQRAETLSVEDWINLAKTIKIN